MKPGPQFHSLFPELPVNLAKEPKPAKQGPPQLEAPGQGVMTFDRPQRFTTREVDPRNPHFNDEPSAHVDAYGLVRDNTVTTRRAYKDAMSQNNGVWDNPADHPTTRRTLGPSHPLSTLQSERETSTPSQKPRRPNGAPPKVIKVRGQDVLIDGHHRVSAARMAGKDIDVDYLDTDDDPFPDIMPMRRHQMLGY